MDITPIINAIIAMLAALATAFVVPWLKRRIAAADMEKFMGWVDIAVAAAEQLYTSLDGDAKKQYVLNYLKVKGYNVSTEDVENAIEAAVLKLHNALYGTTPDVAKDTSPQNEHTPIIT